MSGRLNVKRSCPRAAPARKGTANAIGVGIAEPNVDRLTMHYQIAFVGGGNMAQAMVSGLLQVGVPPHEVLIIDPDVQQLKRVQGAHGVRVADTPEGNFDGVDLIVWAVKPQVLRSAAEKALPPGIDALHLSVAAGVRLSELTTWLRSARVVRAMPNTPAIVRAGVTALQAASGVDESERRLLERLLGGIGRTFWVNTDAEMDGVTAVSGSGPAYVFHFLESLQSAGEELGFSPQMAHDLALWVVGGAVQQAAASPESFAELRRRVTSKGGTTEAAMEVLHARNCKSALAEAVKAAADRARELGDQVAQG